MYYWLEKCNDYNRLKSNLKENQLLIIEDILESYNADLIELYILEDEDGFPILENIKLLASEEYSKYSGYEIPVLEWYEDFKNTDYLIDVFNECE